MGTPVFGAKTWFLTSIWLWHRWLVECSHHFWLWVKFSTADVDTDCHAWVHLVCEIKARRPDPGPWDKVLVLILVIDKKSWSWSWSFAYKSWSWSLFLTESPGPILVFGTVSLSSWLMSLCLESLNTMLIVLCTYVCKDLTGKSTGSIALWLLYDCWWLSGNSLLCTGVCSVFLFLVSL